MPEEWQDVPELHPLDSGRAKVTRAAQQAHHLMQHCEAFQNSSPVHLSARRAGTGHDVYLEGRRPPRYLGLILGEVMHDLRSALDHVAWSLAIDHSGPETVSAPNVARLIQFPIFSTPDGFMNNQALGHFSQAAVDLMERRQPYYNKPTAW